MSELAEILPRLGHRNWIAVVDAAFPEIVQPGIATVFGETLESVLTQLANQPHVRPEVWLDAELQSLTDDDAQGVESFRRSLQTLLDGLPVTWLAHEDILDLISEASRNYRVVVVKTDRCIPYTSVFLRLECGYWSADSEQRFRARSL